MDELIWKSDAINALWKALYEFEYRTKKRFQESEELDVSDWIQHRIFVQNMSDVDRQTIIDLSPAQQWISCLESFPEENEFYLATIYSREMNTAFCDILFYGAPQLCGDRKIGWYFMHDNGGMEQVFNVIAWMPLPKPYKEVEE